MELQLSTKDAAVLHRVIEGYLEEVRTEFGRGGGATREILGDEQESLERILRALHPFVVPR